MSSSGVVPLPGIRAGGLGRWGVRLLTVAGCFLLVLGSTGWWLSSRPPPGLG